MVVYYLWTHVTHNTYGASDRYVPFKQIVTHLFKKGQGEYG